MQRTITLPANSERVELVSGRAFGVLSCTAAFKLEAGRGGKRDMIAGRRFFGERFARLTFIETSGASNTITYEAGESELEISAPTSVGVIVTAKEAPTTTVGHASSILTSTTFSGSSGGLTRKQIVIRNNAAVADGFVLEITDGSDLAFDTISPQSSHTYVTNGIIKVVNADEAPFIVGEIFYTA